MLPLSLFLVSFPLLLPLSFSLISFPLVLHFSLPLFFSLISFPLMLPLSPFLSPFPLISFPLVLTPPSSHFPSCLLPPHLISPPLQNLSEIMQSTRDAMEWSLSQMDRQVGLSFASHFHFALAGLLYRGFSHSLSTVRTRAQDLLTTLFFMHTPELNSTLRYVVSTLGYVVTTLRYVDVVSTLG